MLEWEKKPKKSQLDLIKKQLDKEGIIVSRDLGIGKEYRFKGEALDKIFNQQETHYTGGTKNSNLYTELSAFLGGDKEASLFLLRAGIDGIKYKAGTLSGMEDEEGYNYVIFNADDITIEGKEKYADGGELENTELNKIKEAYDFGSEYFESEIYGQPYKIRMNKNHPRNSSRNDDQSIHNLSLINVDYPSAVVFREQYDKLQYQYDKIYDWDIAKEKIQDFFYEIKDRSEDYSNGGDIQAYEEAMGISEFDEGGEAKPKKVYVSIKLDNNLEKIPNTFNEYFTTYDEKTFEELKNGVLKGVVGVSSSPNNIAEWFIYRDCLIVMDYEEFIAINETETINYNDPYQLMKNNLYLFKRLYANITRYGEQEGSYVFTQTLVKILEKMIREINLEMNLAEGQKLSELYRISQFLSPYITRAFPEWIEKNEIKIESPIDLTNAILDFNKLNEGASSLGYGFENPVLSFDELLPIVEKGITNASSVYDSEQEIVLNNRKLNVPKNSQLFFVGKDELGNKRESNKDELIEKYNLKELYKVYFVNAKEIQKYRDFWLKKEEEKFNQKIETGKQNLEIKKSQVTNQLIDYFIQHSIDTVIDKVNKEILSYELGSLEFYDSTKDDYEEMNWVYIPLVNELFSKYTEIVEKSWEEIIENKSVNEVNLYSFNVFQDDANRKLKTYFEQNRDKYEELDNYINTKGRPRFNLGFLEYDLLKSLFDYQDLPEWIDYKELSKMYLKRMGSEIYRYYDKKDLPLISYYKQGGGVLLAPNGKPSNLTPEQYELVRTPEFKAWFGDWENDPETASKIVDENGEPKVVWRGESKDFNKFDYKKLGSRLKTAWRKAGFYFAPTKSSAEQYMFFMGTRILKEFFLNIRNPYTLDSNEFYGVMDWGSLPNQRFKTNKSATDYANSQVEMIKSKNHDGFFVTILEDDNTVEIVAFEPNQIKLANGTNTTFDGNNPDIRFKMGGQPFIRTESQVSSSKVFIPNVRGGWTKDKIIKYFKLHGSDVISTYRLVKYISEFENWQQFKEHIFYHGTTNYIEKGLKPSITMSEREAERSGGGGYGIRYFGVSLTSRKRTAESFSGMYGGVTIYPVILKRDAKVIERTDLQDASDIEDIIVELYEQGVDAVWIGGGEEELVVINPFSVLLYKKGKEYHSVFGGFKSIPLTDEKIKEIYDNSLKLWENYSEEYKKKENKEERENYLRSLPPIQFEKGGLMKRRSRKRNQ